MTEAFRRRFVSVDDVEELTAFYNICEIDDFGAADYEVEEVRDEWADLDLDEDLLVWKTRLSGLLAR
ncbi:hypothetical protein BH23CHL5_BH23CHL5_23320 [soil metagenome]